ncbi:class I SAM-dependent methyltransferase [Blastococcus haudaquaticus]|uniref:Methyltransferase domain-containing protein n=1 Tax=Blastococcus haudaquaticus TaxID=1938745 RepID=A0A286GE65_9ACTN|nr:methyltransferase domain-containing protein [Blastococcus haudaquaticus]SOD93788.1 Methyltransferase domain-containing protein [Blastococcus haudaquaticus]
MTGHGPTPDLGRPLGDSALQSRTLESVASAVNYHTWLTDLARPHLGDHPVEIGSGLGDYACRWLDAGLPEITVTEADPDRLAVLRSRFAGRDDVHVRAMNVLAPQPAAHSALVAANVLEHIPDDVRALRAAHEVLRPGGSVVLIVPAFQLAMSRFDREVGHVRRYTRKSLRTALTAAGLVVDEVRYIDVPGLFAWFVGMRLLRMRPGDGALLTVWDRMVVPATRWVEERVGAPFGKSVFAVAHVPEVA